VYESSTLEDEEHVTAANLRALKSELVQGAMEDAVNIEPSPYLVGWHFSVDYVETGYFAELDELGLEGLEFYINKITDKIDLHFKKSTMNHPPQKYLSKTHFQYHVGSTNGEQNEVNGKRIGIKHSFKLDGKQVIIRQYASAFSVLYESKTDKRFHGSINDIVAKNHAKVLMHRIGPDPKEGDFSADIENGYFTLEDIPFGEYDPKVVTECQCEFDIKNSVVFDKESLDGVIIIEPGSDKVNIVIELLDSADNPLKDRTVELEQASCLDQGVDGNSLIITESAATDSNGMALFEHMYVGDYKVKVDGTYIKTIHSCSGGLHQIILNPSWRLNIDYTNPLSLPDHLIKGSIEFKNFSLDCAEPIDQGDSINGVTCAWVSTKPFSDVRTKMPVEVIYSGDLLYTPDLEPLFIYSKGIIFNANAKDPIITTAGSLIYEGSSAHTPYDSCFGNFPSGGLEQISESKKIEWTSSGDVHCHFVLEPCRDEACSAY
jgi:hypothetical protein